MRILRALAQLTVVLVVVWLFRLVLGVPAEADLDHIHPAHGRDCPSCAGGGGRFSSPEEFDRVYAEAKAGR